MRNKSILALAAATLLLGITSTASAALVWQLDTVYNNGPQTPVQPGPWGTLTLEDKGSFLELTIQSSLKGSGEFFDKIGMSYLPGATGPGAPTVTLMNQGGVFAVDSAGFELPPVNFPGGQLFNIVFDFNQAAGNRFDGNDWVRYNIGVDDVGYFTSLLMNNSIVVAGHVGGLANGQSVGITGGFQEIPVPEPATIIAGSLLLLPFAATMIRRFRRN